MFERFTEQARQVVSLAQDEARGLKHNYIGTEHILLGLLREEEGLAARVLASLDITVEQVRGEVARIVGPGDEVTTGQVPFTPRTKKVLELALREALSLGDNHIGPEHILLGLVREGDGVAVRILLDFGADGDKIRDDVIRAVSGHRPLAAARPRRRRVGVNPWEHAVLPLGSAAELSAELLDAWGQEGWELITVVGDPADLRAVFRRAARPTDPPDHATT
jgi:ATP-dependent Clp protease ATP-binding subunit ClpC